VQYNSQAPVWQLLPAGVQFVTVSWLTACLRTKDRCAALNITSFLAARMQVQHAWLCHPAALQPRSKTKSGWDALQHAHSNKNDIAHCVRIANCVKHICCLSQLACFHMQVARVRLLHRPSAPAATQQTRSTHAPALSSRRCCCCC
jgi:hypothetical protein